MVVHAKAVGQLSQCWVISEPATQLLEDPKEQWPEQIQETVSFLEIGEQFVPNLQLPSWAIQLFLEYSKTPGSLSKADDTLLHYTEEVTGYGYY